MQNNKLALQGYNFGNGYISWARSNYGGYTAANAAEFSDMMAQRMGWRGYGDKQYVPHVLRYYAFGRIPMGTGSQAIVAVALTQEGNGGDPVTGRYQYRIMCLRQFWRKERYMRETGEEVQPFRI